MRILHLGCGPYKIGGMENSDIDEFNITSKKSWENIEDNSIDAIVMHHVIQEWQWRVIVGTLERMYRALAKGGVLRLGVPHIDSGKSIEYLLSWGNVNLFSETILTKVLERIGYNVKKCEGGQTFSGIPLITEADNRLEETLFLEAYKQ